MGEETILRVCTAYMPPLDYFAAIWQAGKFTVDLQENYRKQTFRNRALIATSQGVQVLSLPCVKTAGNHTPVEKILLSDHENWQREHWRSICTAYNKSPYFLYYRDGLEPFFERSWTYLVDLNTALTDFFMEKLKMSAERVPAQADVSRGEPDSVSAAPFVPPLDFTPKSPVKYRFEPYLQTFPVTVASGYLSILDLLFNTGPEASVFLRSAARAIPE